MTKHIPATDVPDPLNEVVDELLQCGGALSQMIAGMVEFEASGRSAPDAAPIPEVAHDLICSVSVDVARRYSRRDLKTAAKIVKEITDAICSDIYAIPPDEYDRLTTEPPEAGSDLDSDSLTVTEYSCGNKDIDHFALVVLRTSCMICELVENLTNALRPDAFPGESHGSVVVEMLFGSMATALESVDPSEIVRAADLIEQTTARVIEHLQVADQLSRRMQSNDGVGRGYG